MKLKIMKSSRVAQRGVTLIELMVTLVVMAILFSVASPAFKSYTANSLADTVYRILQSDIAFARHLAVDYSTNVSVIPITNDWTKGWRIELANGTVQRTRGKLDDKVSITSAQYTTATPIQYNAQGFSTLPGALLVDVSECSGQRKRTLSIGISGLLKVTEAAC